MNTKTAISRSHTILRRTLVTGQIAVSVVLLSGAALLLRSFEKIEDQNLGMQTGGVVTVNVALPWFRYNTDQKTMEFYLRLESALSRLPGTRAVAITNSIPPAGGPGLRFAGLIVQGRPAAPPGTGGNIASRQVTPDYFRALDIPIVRGRSFTDQDPGSDQREAVISRLMAAELFPHEDPIGQRIKTAGPDSDGWFTIVGVADNVKNSGLTQPEQPEIYFLRRNVSADWDTSRSIVLIDSVMPPAAVDAWARSEVASIDPTVPVDIEPLNQAVRRLADRPRFETALLSFFAFTGLALSIVGLYALVAFMTTRRMHEIGIRMALGATKSQILRLIATDGLRMVLTGIIVGLGAAMAITQTLKALLYQVSTFDPLTFVVVTLLLSAVAVVAILIPARDGMRVDPAVTLRAE